jgi:serine/threonine-protein kinase
MRLGRYELRALLGTGGFASVFLARVLERPGRAQGVAVKRLHPRLVTDGDALARLLDEASLTGAVDSPHVRRLVDVIRVAGEPMLVLEWVEGLALADLARPAEGRTLERGLSVRVVLDILEGLAAVHGAAREDGARADLVHRDVSPHNVLVGVDGRARLADFGVAAATTRGLVAAARGVRGKQGYMAPEQRSGGAVDARADLFALGVVAAELFAGRSRRDRGRADAFVPLGALVAEVIDPDLRAWCARAVAEQPEGRFPDAASMGEALAAVASPASREALGAWVRACGGDALVRQREALEAAHVDEGALAVHVGATTTFEPSQVEGAAASPRGASRSRRRGPILAWAFVVGGLAAVGFAVPRLRAALRGGARSVRERELQVAAPRTAGAKQSGKIDHAAICSVRCGEVDVPDGAGSTEHVVCMPCPSGGVVAPNCGEGARYRVEGIGSWSDRVADTSSGLRWTRGRMHDESLAPCLANEEETGGALHDEPFCCQSEVGHWARCNHAGALAFCTRRGERLPTREELRTIMGPNHAVCAFDAWWSWTASPGAGDSSAWYSGFQGDEYDQDRGELHRFRCVASAR